MVWCGRGFSYVFPRPTLVMAVVNVTPDSFFAGGRRPDCSAAVDHGLKMTSEGADLLDVGGESTRPGAEPTPEAEEMRRVIPVVARLAAESGRPVSVDTRRPRVAREALAAGASVVNDVESRRVSPEMWQAVADAGAGYVAMHMQGDPETMQRNPAYGDVAGEIRAFWADRLERLSEAGVPNERVAVDPGFGFGKTLEHNLTLLARWAVLTSLGRPVVAGVSRKSFIGLVTGAAVDDRLPGSLACGLWAARLGAAMVRVHDPAAWVQALRMQEAIAAAGSG